MVPRVRYHHAVVRHAVLALGSLHERYGMGDRSIFASNLDTVQGGLALRQYYKAILIKDQFDRWKAVLRYLSQCLFTFWMFRGMSYRFLGLAERLCVSSPLTYCILSACHT